MKLKVVYIMFVLLFVLAACSAQSETDEQADNGQEVQQDNSVDEEQAGDEASKVDEDQASETDDEVKEGAELEPPAEPLYKINPTNYSIEPISEADPKVVLLTIDDAPDKRALDMAKTLKRLDAPAIFFVNGHFIETDEKRAILKEIYEMGFVIGNHTKTHANLKSLTEEEQREEILSVSNTVEEVTGERPKFFRAPFGVNTDFSRSLAEQEGMQLMNWSYGYDFVKEYMTKEKIADIMVNTELLSNGSNLLMHDREWTADALEEIVNGLREKGYEFVDPKSIQGYAD
ncbi:polysaccharide deacetylase family protein [Sporosarcina sp. OR05]|uniref:polysaccharide deacetylase family protein n=1 Tax=Sporosarcina sp. OR05 TaxID=2969819 RepID=UPI00352B07D5